AIEVAAPARAVHRRLELLRLPAADVVGVEMLRCQQGTELLGDRRAVQSIEQREHLAVEDARIQVAHQRPPSVPACTRPRAPGCCAGLLESTRPTSFAKPAARSRTPDMRAPSMKHGSAPTPMRLSTSGSQPTRFDPRTVVQAAANPISRRSVTVPG